MCRDRSGRIGEPRVIDWGSDGCIGLGGCDGGIGDKVSGNGSSILSISLHTPPLSRLGSVTKKS